MTEQSPTPRAEPVVRVDAEAFVDHLDQLVQQVFQLGLHLYRLRYNDGDSEAVKLAAVAVEVTALVDRLERLSNEIGMPRRGVSLHDLRTCVRHEWTDRPRPWNYPG